MPSTRPETPAPSRRLAGLPGYGNGRAGAAQAFAHRLGSNEAPDGLAPAILEAVVPALAAANRYPDLRGETLAAALARRHGLLPENVAVAAGSIVLLGQIVRAWCDPGDGIVAPWRSYEAYPIIAGLAGGRLVEAPLDRDHRLDPAAILARIGADTRIALICNPNNPTGTALAPTVLDDLLADVPSQVLIVLDEAYCDYSDEAPTAAASPARRLARHPEPGDPAHFLEGMGPRRHTGGICACRANGHRRDPGGRAAVSPAGCRAGCGPCGPRQRGARPNPGGAECGRARSAE